MFSMISTLKLISSSVSTLAAAKTLVDNCTIHLFYKSEEGEIFELQWKLVRLIIKFQ